MLHDVATRTARGRPFVGAVHRVAFSPDGARLATGDSRGDVTMCDVATGHPAVSPFSMAAGQVGELAWSPDGARLAVLATTGQVSARQAVQVTAVGDLHAVGQDRRVGKTRAP